MARVLLVCTLAMSAYMAATGLFGDRGLLNMRTLQHQVQGLEDLNNIAAAENEALARRAGQLRNGTAALEQIAREEHGFVRDGEVIYQFDEDETETGQKH